MLEVPATPELLSPVVVTVPLQLLAYHVATLRGCDVDQPRNLAKSVTVGVGVSVSWSSATRPGDVRSSWHRSGRSWLAILDGRCGLL